MIIGLEFIDFNFKFFQKKIGFVCVWFVFVFVLFLLNCFYKWKIYRMILEFKLWKFIVFLLIGFIGGGFLVIVGSGVDVCSFSVLMFFF